MSVIFGPSSVTFLSDFIYPDPTLNSFTWKGNEQFFIPPGDQIAQLHLDLDWGGHNEVNHFVQFFWANPGDEGHGPAGDYIVSLTFAPNGRWLEQFSPADFSPDGDFIGGPNGNPLPSWDVAFVGRHHLKYWGPNASLPPQDQILAEGAWASHHHAAHHGWLVTA